MIIPAPDDLTAQALKRLRQDQDGTRLLDWLRRSLELRDAANRPMVDGVQLRMGQGAAMTLAELIGHIEGTASKGVLSDTRIAGRPARSDTSGRASQ